MKYSGTKTKEWKWEGGVEHEAGVAGMGEVDKKLYFKNN